MGASWACRGRVVGVSWACRGRVVGVSWACRGYVVWYACAANSAPVSAPVCANGIQPTFSAGASAAGASDAAPSSMRQLFVVEERPAAALVAAATAFALPAAEMSETIATAESTATAA